MNPLICATVALFGTSTLLPAATYFTENFDGGVMTSGQLALGTGLAGATTSFAGNNFAITSGVNSRIYLGTTGTDYSAVNFVFEATVTVPTTTSPWSIVFFGMGNSTAGGTSGTQPFGEPITGSDLFMTVRPDNNNLEERDNATSAVGAVRATSATAVSNSIFLLRMTWDSTTQNALFEYDVGANGSVENSFNVDGSNNGFTGSNSQLVFGGGNGITFDNISVTVPEPGAALLGGLGLLGLLRRRR